MPEPMHVLIIGGGASGVLAAAHLLNGSDGGVRVTMVERSALLGCGIAYATTHPDHLLNTRVAQMSAFPDRPGHFADWLATSGAAPGATEVSFVSRAVYGKYLLDLLTPWREAPGPLTCLQGECTHLDERTDAVLAHLADGSVLRADRAILATGHAVPAQPAAPLRGAWDFAAPPAPDAHVAIIGTGLSMIDHVLTLLSAGHRGQISSLSRRGLLPQVHAPSQPLPLPPDQIPIGAPVSRVLAWLRRLARRAEAQGGTWRDAVDALRPHVAAVWQGWGQAERARFLRHGAAVWEVHRHRMPPVSAARLGAAIQRGQLRVLRGRFERAEALGEGAIRLHITPRDARTPSRLDAAHVIDCRGIRRDPVRNATPVVRSLLAEGRARLDALALGLDTTPRAQVIDRDGRASGRIYAIGPSARGAIWEITAIPDIRLQAADLAGRLKAALPDPVA